MNELIKTMFKEYRKKETLKKEFFKQLENSDLPYKTIIEMLEELINLYKN